MVANLGDRLLDLVERHHDREKLVASVAGRDIKDVPDPGPAGHIVEAGPGHVPVLVGGNQTGDHRVVQIADLGRRHQLLTIGMKRFGESGGVRQRDYLARLCENEGCAGGGNLLIAQKAGKVLYLREYQHP